jgi:hypothetical protein
MLAIAGGIIIAILFFVFLGSIVEALIAGFLGSLTVLVAINFPKTIAAIVAICVVVFAFARVAVLYRHLGSVKFAQLVLLGLVLIAITSLGGYLCFYFASEYGSTGWAVAVWLVTLILDVIVYFGGSWFILTSESRPRSKLVSAEANQKDESDEGHSDGSSPLRSFKSWSPEEDNALLDAFAANAKPEQIAVNHGRTIAAIKTRLRKITSISP